MPSDPDAWTTGASAYYKAKYLSQDGVGRKRIVEEWEDALEKKALEDEGESTISPLSVTRDLETRLKQMVCIICILQSSIV